MGADVERAPAKEQALYASQTGVKLESFWIRAAILLFLSAAGCAFFLLVGARFGVTGFPLDDAWIHQTYARNLALSGEWAFIPGEPSAGSTAPLWSAALAVGYRLNLAPFVWTYLVGWLSLWAISLAGMQIFARLHPGAHLWSLAAGAFLSLEWHLVWAAVSGMETLLSALLVLLVFVNLFQVEPPWFRLGALVGLSVWVRPDGITLLGPLGLTALASCLPWRQRFRSLAWVSAGFLLLFIPYLVFNRSISGEWWPNTLFAKQAEYAAELQAGLLNRLAEQGQLPLVGAGALLLPGFLYALVWALRRRDWASIAMAAWAAGYLVLFALRLPVSYQHGRYAMPVMPVFFLLGLSGMFELVERNRSTLWGRVVTRAWMASTVLVVLGFLLLGAQAYQRDVAVIQEEMVTTARWLMDNTEPEALIAAHDIGAIGYLAGRRLLDLAGLVSPQVIPFIRDETALAAYLDERGADYLVTFPGWYPDLVARGILVYASKGGTSPLLGGENMVVYRWGADR